MKLELSKSISPFVLVFIISLLVVFTLVVATRFFLLPNVEMQLSQKIEKTLKGNATGKLFINISGRDVNVRGLVESKLEKINVENLISKVSGVRHINSEILIKNHSNE